MSKYSSPIRGRTIEELLTPRLIAMPPPDVFDGELIEIERTMVSTVPDAIRKRIAVSRSLAVYGGFCYDFISVSAFWSLTCVEMALWEKFAQLHPLKAADQKRNTFGSLAKWAIQQKIVPDAEVLLGMVNLRNSFAHPKGFSPIWTPGMAVTIFQNSVEIVNYLWPE